MNILTLVSRMYKKTQLCILNIANQGKIPCDFILTGLPRSGTSLMVKLLNDSDNCVCFNELYYDVDLLPVFFRKMRKKLLAAKPVPNKFDKAGNVATDTVTLSEGPIPLRQKVIPLKSDDIVLGSKETISYLNHINIVLKFGYKVVALVRDPVYTIGSWNSEKAKEMPVAKVTDGNLHSHWRNLSFSSDDKIERQAQVWEHYARLIWSLRSKVKIVRYEDLTGQQEPVMNEVVSFLGIHLPDNFKKLENCNVNSRYQNLQEIKNAVEKYCPSRKYFEYE